LIEQDIKLRVQGRFTVATKIGMGAMWAINHWIIGAETTMIGVMAYLATAYLIQFWDFYKVRSELERRLGGRVTIRGIRMASDATRREWL
jgi:hypothetical protein